MKESNRVLLALAVGLVAGILIAFSGNAALLRAADSLAVLGTLWINAIRMTVIPLVISLLITGVTSAASLRAVGRIGGKTLLVFVLLLAGVTIVVIPLATLIFEWLPDDLAAHPALPAGAAEAASDLAASTQPTDLATWLVSLLPTNPVAAAANGAMLPLVLFTMLLALAIVHTPTQSRETLVGFFRALSEAMLVLVRWIVAFAPLGVFALILPLAAHGGAKLAGSMGFYIVVYSIACICVILLLYPVVAIFSGIPVRKFARSALPAQLIGFSSSSSIAALPSLVETAERNLHLPTSVTGFVLPLAASTFKIAGPVTWTFGSLFVAWFYGIELHVPQLATIGFAAVFLGFAAPGVPRGGFLMLTPLFLAIGLPPEGIGILIAVDAIPDLFATVLNVTGNLAATALACGREKQLSASARLEPGSP